MGRTRMYVTAMAVLMVPAGLGVVTVHASPTCQKFVRTYVTVPVRNRVSKTTALAWARWRQGHPNWKPNPKIHRPAYKMTQREAVEKVAFACQVPTDPVMLDALFTPADLRPPMADVALPPEYVTPPVETTDVVVPDLIPPLDAGGPPVAEMVLPPSFLLPPYVPPVYGSSKLPPVPNPASPSSGNPVIPPVLPPVAAPVPEPSSLLLLLTGAGSAALGLVRRRQTAA